MILGEIREALDMRNIGFVVNDVSVLSIAHRVLRAISSALNAKKKQVKVKSYAVTFTSENQGKELHLDLRFQKTFRQRFHLKEILIEESINFFD